MRRIAGIAALLIGMSCSGSVARAAIRFDWDEHELACSARIGVALGVPPSPSSSYYVRHITWISDLVVYGTVTEVKHDGNAAYPTIATVQVLSTKKGTAPSGGVLYVNLESGPFWSAAHQRMLYSTHDGEPTVSAGTSVLLFLTDGYQHTDTTPNPYALGPSHFRLVDNNEWLIDDEEAHLASNERVAYSVTWVNTEIALTVAWQRALCH
ncbi:MAG TPA: hypothetical protein VMS04_12640 [Vicinamibacterales bacterium]|jgi:hypothetical protein|nr:hypothetical protein [Vicinamibacterales bacterium]